MGKEEMPDKLIEIGMRVKALEAFGDQVVRTMDGMRKVMESQSTMATEQGKVIDNLLDLVHEIQDMLLKRQPIRGT